MVLEANFEELFRSFIHTASVFESTFKNQDRADQLAIFEIEGLCLIRNLKKGPLTVRAKKRIKVKYVNSNRSIKRRKLSCCYCQKEFNAVSIKSLQQHIRTSHKDKSQVSVNDYEEEDKVECLLLKKNNKVCGKMVARDMLYRHVQSKKLHKTPSIPPKGSKFWGFKCRHKKPTEVINKRCPEYFTNL